MCEPATIAMAVSATSSLFQGFAAKQQADYQAQVAKNNAEISERKARNAERRGQQERDHLRLDNAQRVAEGRTGFASGNVLLDAGSADSWEQDLQRSLEIDEATSRENAAQEYQGHMDQAQNFRAEASAASSSGTAALIGGGLSFGAGMLGMAAKSGFGRKPTAASILKKNQKHFAKKPFVGPSVNPKTKFQAPFL